MIMVTMIADVGFNVFCPYDTAIVQNLYSTQSSLRYPDVEPKYKKKPKLRGELPVDLF